MIRRACYMLSLSLSLKLEIFVSTDVPVMKNRWFRSKVCIQPLWYLQRNDQQSKEEHTCKSMTAVLIWVFFNIKEEQFLSLSLFFFAKRDTPVWSWIFLHKCKSSLLFLLFATIGFAAPLVNIDIAPKVNIHIHRITGGQEPVRYSKYPWQISLGRYPEATPNY